MLFHPERHEALAGAPWHEGTARAAVREIAAALIAAQNGAKILRVHDVRETVQALAVWSAVREQAAPGTHFS